MKVTRWVLSILLPLCPSASALFLVPSVPLSISRLYNNIASGPNADFDPHYGGSFPSQYLPTGQFYHDGVHFVLPESWEGSKDNILADGQVLDARDAGFTREFHMLYAGDWIDGESGARFTFSFEDGTQDEIEVSIKNWWTLHWLNDGVIKAPFHNTPSGPNHNLTQIYHWSTSVRSLSPLASITLPEKSWPNRAHIFAISLVPSVIPSHAPDTSGPALIVRRSVPTTKWRMIGDQKAYAIEITVANGLPSALSADPRFWVKSPLYVSYDSSSFRTVQMGIIHRIMPSDEVRVKVWAVPTQPGYQTVLGGSSAITVIDARGDIVVQQAEVPTTLASSERYDTPEWWDDAKFGIFIHWGVFSVPGWGPVGRYTEWYDWWLHADGKSSESWNYHRDMYGEDFVYDDFIPQFTASKFNASEWVHLFANAGAKYFVLVTKHHDGFALFDTANSTHRSSYHLGPKRDFVKELFASAKSERPGLHRGTYYSMPEWFNPDAGSYGFGNWPGHLARSPYNNKLEPYTGRIEGKDYLQEIQLAHMMALAKDYETEIMWCDIGGPNLTVQFAREWYPYAESQGRQVIMNNRCGALPQFDTPEYARFSSIQNGKWETSEGIDPYSYGYNRRTKAEDYRSASTIITTLVDIVSKNGNYLLNIGPTGEGEIIKPMVDRLLEVGKWLAHSGECIYGTDYFFLGAESGDIRFTRTPTTFCIIALSRPQNGMLVVQKSVPVLPGDEIELLGAGEDGRRLHQENRKV